MEGEHNFTMKLVATHVSSQNQVVDEVDDTGYGCFVPTLRRGRKVDLYPIAQQPSGK